MNIDDQFEELITQPLANNASLFTEKPCIIIIDGLDEGMHKDRRIWSSFLDTLSKWSTNLPTLNYRLILLSRDLRNMRVYRDRSSRRLSLPSTAHKGTKEWQDIYTFLAANLGAASGCSKPLSNPQIEVLATRADGLFIWAATAVKFLRQEKEIYEYRIDTLLPMTRSEDGHTEDEDEPLAVVHSLYHQVLETTFSNLKLSFAKKAVQLFLGITLVSRSLWVLPEIAKLQTSLKILDDRLRRLISHSQVCDTRISG